MPIRPEMQGPLVRQGRFDELQESGRPIEPRMAAE
jgi:hypothetical protein